MGLVRRSVAAYFHKRLPDSVLCGFALFCALLSILIGLRATDLKLCPVGAYADIRTSFVAYRLVANLGFVSYVKATDSTVAEIQTGRV